MLKVRLAALSASAVVVVAGLAMTVPASAAARSSGSSASSAAWRVAKSVTGSDFPQFSSVAAASGTSAWAFESASSGKPRAYELAGGSWQLKSFPGKANESVMATSSSSSSDVWAVTDNFVANSSAILRFNGHSWSQVKTFSRLDGNILALSSSDVWVFGNTFDSATLAVHYNGHAWTNSPGSKGLIGASALSAKNIWAFGPTNVSHWNGSGWKSTSVAKLLPKNSELCGSRLTGIAAISGKNVFLAGTGGCQDQGGPFVLLHYNGSTWRRLALKPALGAPEAIIGDGSGGVWIPVGTGAPVSGSMEHYGNGKLTSVNLPFTPAHLVLFSAAIGQHTKTAFAVGFTRKSFSANTSTAVILRYGT
jgi:hypothetical protein